MDPLAAMSAIPLPGPFNNPAPAMPMGGGGGPTAGAVDPMGGGAPAGAAQQPWWQKLLPTAGGVLGGILGGAADVASLGAAAPLINPITGAAAGGAAGQMAENALGGKKVLQGNDLSSGIENGVGEGIGLGAGKVIGALGEGMAGAGAKAEGKLVEKEAGQSAVNDATATKLNFGGISSKLAGDGELGLGKSQQFVKSMGFDHTNPYDMGKVADAVEPLNNVYDRALSNSKPVDMSDAGKLFGATAPDTSTGLGKAELAAMKSQHITPELAANGTITGGSTAPEASGVYQGIDQSSPVGQALADFNKSIKAEPNAALPEQMNATDVRKLQQAVGRQIGNTQTIINNAELNGTYNADAHAQLDSLNGIYSKLGDKIKTPEVDQAIKDFQVTDADRQGLTAKYGDKLGNHVADTIGNAQGADDLLGPMQDLTKAGRASRMAINDIENVTNSPRAVERAKFEANGGVAPSSVSSGGSALGDVAETAAKAVHSPTGAVLAAGRKLHEAGVTPKIAKGLGDVITRTRPMIAPAVVAGSNIPNVAEGMQPPAGAVPMGAAPGAQPGAMPGAPGAPVNPVNSTLDTLMQSLQQPGAALVPGYSSMVAGATGLAPAVQKNELAGETASELAPTFANAGGAAGMGGGLVDSLLSKVPGTAQNTYTREQQTAAAQLAQLLGISPEAALQMLPRFTQTPQTAAPQMAGVGGLVSNLTSGLPAQ